MYYLNFDLYAFLNILTFVIYLFQQKMYFTLFQVSDQILKGLTQISTFETKVEFLYNMKGFEIPKPIPFIIWRNGGANLKLLPSGVVVVATQFRPQMAIFLNREDKLSHLTFRHNRRPGKLARFDSNKITYPLQNSPGSYYVIVVVQCMQAVGDAGLERRRSQSKFF